MVKSRSPFESPAALWHCQPPQFDRDGIVHTLSQHGQARDVRSSAVNRRVSVARLTSRRITNMGLFEVGVEHDASRFIFAFFPDVVRHDMTEKCVKWLHVWRRYIRVIVSAKLRHQKPKSAVTLRDCNGSRPHVTQVMNRHPSCFGPRVSSKQHAEIAQELACQLGSRYPRLCVANVSGSLVSIKNMPNLSGASAFPSARALPGSS
jgi:hypothetical protein